MSLVRYQRPLEILDTKFDVSVNATDNMTVIWALGLMRLPDSLQLLYLPQSHEHRQIFGTYRGRKQRG